QANQHAAARVAADAAVGDLHTGKSAADVIAPTLRDRVAEKDQRAFILLHALGPGAPAFDPQLFEPIRAANRPRARKAIIGVGNLELGIGLCGCDTSREGGYGE